MAKKFWLFKSEPSEFSWDELKKSTDQTTFWDGVRNYQARNFLRDEIKKGDGVLFYQSSTEPLAIVGYCEVVKEGYADHTQFDKKNDHYDEKTNPKNPTWFWRFKKVFVLYEIYMNMDMKSIVLKTLATF
jgi:predicted RNA-binding protein with PUA-like domain